MEDNLEVGRFCNADPGGSGTHSNRVAHNAEEALAEIERAPFRFEAVFSDVVMPGMGGIELAKRHRSTHPDLPVCADIGLQLLSSPARRSRLRPRAQPYSAEQVAGAFRKIAQSGTVTQA